MYNRKFVVDKIQVWEKTGLLDGLQSDSARAKMVLLLDNTAITLTELKNDEHPTKLKDFWGQIALPIVRRVFGSLVELDTFHVTTTPATLFPFPETLETKPIIMFSDRIKTVVPMSPNFIEALNSNVNAEAEFAANLSDEIQSELTELFINPVIFYQLRCIESVDGYLGFIIRCNRNV